MSQEGLRVYGDFKFICSPWEPLFKKFIDFIEMKGEGEKES